jgi:hypothetical protein
LRWVEVMPHKRAELPVRGTGFPARRKKRRPVN